jgi:hypothetical protein
VGQTGLIAKEQQGLFLPRLPQYRGPPRLTPFETFGLIEVIRDKAGFLVSKPHIPEQGREGMGVVEHPKVAPNEVLNHGCIPASRGITTVLRTPFDPLGQLLSLGFGEFTGTSWRGFVNQAGHALEEELLSVVTNSLLTETQHVGYFADALTLSEGQQSLDAFDQFQGAAGIGFLEAAIELLAGERAEL